MEGEVDQLTLEMVLVEPAEKWLVGQLYDRLYEVTGGLVLQED